MGQPDWMPDKWQVYQEFQNVVFCHYPLDTEVLRPHVPQELPLDAFEGKAYVSLVGLLLRDCHLRWNKLFPLNFQQLNVRTYVTIDGKPGVYFLSMDANSWLMTTVGRVFYDMAYYHAQASSKQDGEWTTYRYQRKGADPNPPRFDVRFRPTGEPFEAQPGSLEQFLAERYWMYQVDKDGSIYAGELFHPHWKMRKAEAIVEHNSMTAPYGFALPEEEMVAYFSKGVPTVSKKIVKVP
ncbi:MAG TPA: DUF2071 domain-containing protein [Bacilli bacterium]|nr:DUF2071 domain-containing protein [Bacilli bacterium]